MLNTLLSKEGMGALDEITVLYNNFGLSVTVCGFSPPLGQRELRSVQWIQPGEGHRCGHTAHIWHACGISF